MNQHERVFRHHDLVRRHRNQRRGRGRETVDMAGDRRRMRREHVVDRDAGEAVAAGRIDPHRDGLAVGTEALERAIEIINADAVTADLIIDHDFGRDRIAVDISRLHRPHLEP